MDQNKRDKNILLFCCAGLGMGNASRTTAVIEEIEKTFIYEQNRPTEIIIATWGAGLNFFQQYVKNSNIKITLIPLKSYNSWFLYPFIYIINSIIIQRILFLYKPSISIIDSDYHFFPFKLNRVKLLSISQAPDVVQRAKLNNYRPTNMREQLSFYFREKLDAKIQILMADKVIVPCFLIDNTNFNKKIINIPLIVRSEFQASTTLHSDEKIGILLSGSGIEKENFLELKKKYNFKILSPDQITDDFISHSKELDKFEIIFTQGGLSSISEVIARKKFLIVFPIKNHPEQIINALEVQRLGLGVKADISNLKNFSNFLEFISSLKNQSKTQEITCNGANKMASIIAQVIDEENIKI